MKKLLVLAVAALAAIPAFLATSPAQADSTARWSKIASGSYHTCAIQESGKLFCWGANGGRLGDGTSEPRDVPRQIGNATWKYVAPYEEHTCALRTSGTLFCWGENDYGQLGDGTATTRYIPTQVGSAKWTAVTTGTDHSCGIRDSGRLYCWGWNEYGQLGDNSHTNRDLPRQVGSSTSWVAVTAGDGFTCGKTSARIYCWGDNSYGQLGIGSLTAQDTPQRIGNASDWAQIAAGTTHACGIRSVSTGRRLYCWGRGQGGRLGTGNSDQRTTPTQSGTSTAWLNASLGATHTCGIRSSSRYVYCTGLNTYGQLGDDTTTSHSTAAKEIRGFNWAAVDSGLLQTCAIRSYNLYLYCWGNNGNSQLGDGTTTQRNAAVRVD